MDDEGGGEEGNGSGKDRIPDVLFLIVISLLQLIYFSRWH
jgi:hypothetical protein